MFHTETVLSHNTPKEVSMRITFDCSTTETLEYLRVVNSILRSNKETEDNIKAYNTLKELVETFDDRLEKVEAENRRRNVCR